MTKVEKARAERNKELCEKVKNNQYIEPLMPASATWFPPRPIIKKDHEAIRDLYNEDGSPNG